MNPFKNLKSLVAGACFALALIVGTIVPNRAAGQGNTLQMLPTGGAYGTVWAGAGTMQGATNCYYVVSVKTAAPVAAVGGGFNLPGSTPSYQPTPIVRYLHITNDLTGLIFKFYSVSNRQVILDTNGITSTGSTNFTISTTNNWMTTNMMPLLIQHAANDTYEPNQYAGFWQHLVYTTNNAGTITTNVQAYGGLAWAPLGTLATNDVIWQCTTNGSLPVVIGNTTFGVDSGGLIYAGQPGQPLLMQLQCTANGRINVAAGEWR